MCEDYSFISNLVPDKIKRQREKRLAGNPWRFTNMMNCSIEIFYTTAHKDSCVRSLGWVGAKQTLSVDCSFLKGGYIIHIFRNGIECLEPYTLLAGKKDLKVGTTSYDNIGFTRFKSLYSDMFGINFHNRFCFPIEIYFNQKLVATVGSYKGLNFMGGGDSTVYYTNNWLGSEVGNRFAFKEKGSDTFLYEITLVSRTTQNIYVGIVS